MDCATLDQVSPGVRFARGMDSSPAEAGVHFVHLDLLGREIRS